MRNYRRWTPNEQKLLKHEIQVEHLSYRAIAERHGRSTSAIKRQVYDLGLRNVIRRYWPPEDDDQLIECYQKQLPVSETAEILGREYDAVISRAKALRRAGIKIPSLKKSVHKGGNKAPGHRPLKNEEYIASLYRGRKYHRFDRNDEKLVKKLKAASSGNGRARHLKLATVGSVRSEQPSPKGRGVGGVVREVT